MTVRTRFAPSPTGYLHIGGARTALFNWLYARRLGGVFVLRIEDTDQERSTAASLEALLEGLNWLGIDWDEGPGKGGAFGPYTQTERLGRYREVADGLLEKGLAYRDYATEEEVGQARADFAKSQGLGPKDDLRKAGFKYKSPWRDKAEVLDRPHVVRFRLPVRDGTLGFDDLVLGRIDKPWDDFDDFVLLRPDGIPLYNFGCVVDDHDMQISHVGRGQEHINSTFPQLMVYDALGWALPQFAHFPLILGPDREKLSKRKHPEADVMLHKHNGVLPQALLNFIARLGWSHGDQETFTREELVQFFGFDHVGTTSGVWNPEKLTWLNEHWFKTLPARAVAVELLPFLHAAGAPDAKLDGKLEKAVLCFRERSKSLKEMAEKVRPYYASGITIEGAAAAKHLTPAGKTVLKAARERLAAVEPWTAEALDPVVKTVSEELTVGMGKVAQPIRVAVTGGTVSPGIGDTLELLGRHESLHRIDAALT